MATSIRDLRATRADAAHAGRSGQPHEGRFPRHAVARTPHSVERHPGMGVDPRAHRPGSRARQPCDEGDRTQCPRAVADGRGTARRVAHCDGPRASERIGRAHRTGDRRRARIGPAGRRSQERALRKEIDPAARTTRPMPAGCSKSSGTCCRMPCGSRLQAVVSR